MNSTSLFAGWSFVDITPSKKVVIVGQYDERISEDVHYPLYATALAVESRNAAGDSLEQAVMISVDLVCAEKYILDELRERVNGKVEGLNPGKILIFATHTHNAPATSENGFGILNWNKWKEYGPDELMTPKEYYAFLMDKLEHLVAEAWNNRMESRAAIAMGYAVTGHCREVAFDDRNIMYGPTDTINFVRCAGPSDHGVELMYFWDIQDRLTGVIVNVACPSQLAAELNVITADYMGAVRKEIKVRMGEDIHVLPQISAAGDQSPIDMIRRNKDGNNKANIFDGIDELGSRVADAVIKQYPAVRAKARGDLIFRHNAENVSLPLRKVTKGEAEKAEKHLKELMKKGELAGWDLFEYVDCLAVLARKKYQEEAPLFRMEMHSIRLGDAAFITNPFELYLEYGHRVKARSKAKQTFVIQLCCGYSPYLPTRQAIEGGAYGSIVSSCMVGPEGGDLLVEYSVAAVNQLWGDRGYLDSWEFGI